MFEPFYLNLPNVGIFTLVSSSQPPLFISSSSPLRTTHLSPCSRNSGKCWGSVTLVQEKEESGEVNLNVTAHSSSSSPSSRPCSSISRLLKFVLRPHSPLLGRLPPEIPLRSTFVSLLSSPCPLTRKNRDLLSPYRLDQRQLPQYVCVEKRRNYR